MLFLTFRWGNLETLETTPQKNGIDIHELMLKFVERFYVAEAMKLCVVGTNMNELESVVRKCFSAIPSAKERHSFLNGDRSRLEIPNFKHYGMPFDDDSLQMIFRIVPTKERFLVWFFVCFFLEDSVALFKCCCDERQKNCTFDTFRAKTFTFRCERLTFLFL